MMVGIVLVEIPVGIVKLMVDECIWWIRLGFELGMLRAYGLTIFSEAMQVLLFDTVERHHPFEEQSSKEMWE